MVGGRWSVVGGRWSVVVLVGGQCFSQPLVSGRWSVVVLVGGRWWMIGGWSVGGAFVLRPTFGGYIDPTP